jgi:hypothetical protein
VALDPLIGNHFRYENSNSSFSDTAAEPHQVDFAKESACLHDGVQQYQPQMILCFQGRPGMGDQ